MVKRNEKKIYSKNVNFLALQNNKKNLKQTLFKLSTSKKRLHYPTPGSEGPRK